MASEGSGSGNCESYAVVETDQRMLRFLREVGAIRNVVDWSSQTIAEVSRMFGIADLSAAPEHLSMADGKLSEVEERLTAMWPRLMRMAGENEDLKRGHGSSFAMLPTRVLQLRQICASFAEATKDLKGARRMQREALERSMRRDIVCAKRGLSAEDADEALASGDGDAELESTIFREGLICVEPELNVENAKERSAEIQKLAEDTTELEKMLSQVERLLESQQVLLDNIESHEDEVASDTGCPG